MRRVGHIAHMGYRGVAKSFDGKIWGIETT
jgi:hypothetical protein